VPLPALFHTERLVVHRAVPEDTDALLRVFGNPAAMRLFAHGRPWTRDELERFMGQYPDSDARLICLPGTVRLRTDPHAPAGGEVIGFGGVGYYVGETTTPDLFYALRSDHWGKGLATELSRAALAYAFAHPEVDFVNASAIPANAPSIRILEKCGLRLIRFVPEANRNLYRTTRDEWEAAVREHDRQNLK